MILAVSIYIYIYIYIYLPGRHMFKKSLRAKPYPDTKKWIPRRTWHRGYVGGSMSKHRASMFGSSQ